MGRRAMWFPPLTFPKASLVSFLWVVICVLVQDSAVILLAPLGFSGFLKTRWPGRREEGGRSRSPEECESLPKPEQPVGAESQEKQNLACVSGTVV